MQRVIEGYWPRIVDDVCDPIRDIRVLSFRKIEEVKGRIIRLQKFNLLEVTRKATLFVDFSLFGDATFQSIQADDGFYSRMNDKTVEKV